MQENSRHIFYGQGECIVTHFATELASLSHRERQGLSVLIPSARLESALIKRLSDVVEAGLTPRFLSVPGLLETLYEKVAIKLGESENSETNENNALSSQSLSSLEVELAFAKLLPQKPYRYIGIGHEHELSVLFEMYCGAECLESWKESALEILKDDLVRSEEGLRLLEDRLNEIEDLFTDFYESLNQKNQTTQTLRQTQLLNRLMDLSDDKLMEISSFLGPIYYFGFTTIQPLYSAFFARLERLGLLNLRISNPPVLFGELNPISQMLEGLGLSDQLKSKHSARGEHDPVLEEHRSESQMTAFQRALRDDDVHEKTSIEIMSAPDVLSELSETVLQVKKALAAGYTPHRVCILLTNESSYGPLLRRLCELEELPVNFALPEPLSSTYVKKGLSAITLLFEGNLRVTDLYGVWNCQFIRNAVLASVEPARAAAFDNEGVTNFSHDALQPDFETRFDRFFETARHSGELIPLLNGVNSEAQKDETAGQREIVWEFFSKLSRVFGLQLTSSGEFRCEDSEMFWSLFVGTCRNYLEETLGPKMPKDLLSSFRESFVELEKLTFELSSKEELSLPGNESGHGSSTNFSFSFKEQLRLVTGKLSLISVRRVGYPFRGVQVLGLAESRYIPFDLVFLCGCVEGDFPRAMPKDLLVDPYIKYRLGLPGWDYVEAMEDTTFTLLASRVPRLVMSYPESKDFSPCVRSRFVDKVLLENSGVSLRRAAEFKFSKMLRSSELSDLSDLSDLSEMLGLSGGLHTSQSKSQTSPISTSKSCSQFDSEAASQFSNTVVHKSFFGDGDNSVSCHDTDASSHDKFGGDFSRKVSVDEQGARSSKLDWYEFGRLSSVASANELTREFAKLSSKTSEPLNGFTGSRVKMSPSGAEKLLRCPYSFLLSSLQLRDIFVEDEDRQLHVGLWIHKVFEDFFMGVPEAGFLSLGEEISRKGTSSLEEDSLISRMLKVCELHKAEISAEPELYLQLTEYSFAKFCRWLSDNIHFSGLSAESEKNVKGARPISILDGRLEVDLRGRMDLLLSRGDDQLIIDFKTNSVPQTKAIKEAFSVQLLLYAYAVQTMSSHQKAELPVLDQKSQSEVTFSGVATGYWKVIDSAFSLAGSSLMNSDGKQLTNAGLKKSVDKSKTDLSELWQKMMKNMESRASEIEAFRGFVPESSSACELCSYRGLCRLDDPRIKENLDNYRRIIPEGF